MSDQEQELSLEALKKLDPVEAINYSIEMLKRYNAQVALLRGVYENAVLHESNATEFYMTINAAMKLVGADNSVGEYSEDLLEKGFFPEPMIALLQHAEENLNRISQSVDTMMRHEDNHDQYHLEKVILDTAYAISDLQKDYQQLQTIKGQQDPIDRFINKLELGLLKFVHCVEHFAKQIGAKLDKSKSAEIERDHKAFTRAFNKQNKAQKVTKNVFKNTGGFLGNVFGKKQKVEQAVDQSALSAPKEQLESHGQAAKQEAETIKAKVKA